MTFSTEIATITESIAIPHALGAETAIQRLRVAEEAMRASDTWLKPEAIAFTWSATSATFAGTAFGFPVTGAVEATDAEVRIALDVPWTAKALLATFRPRVHAALTHLLS